VGPHDLFLAPTVLATHVRGARLILVGEWNKPGSGHGCRRRAAFFSPLLVIDRPLVRITEGRCPLAFALATDTMSLSNRLAAEWT